MKTKASIIVLPSMLVIVVIVIISLVLLRMINK